MTVAPESGLPLADPGKAIARPLDSVGSGRTWALVAMSCSFGLALGALLSPLIQRLAPVAAHRAAPPSTQPAAVMALGRLMPQDDTTTLALPYSTSDARVAQWLVKEGQQLRQGQLVAELDSLPQRQAQRATAAADVAAKRAALNLARSAAQLSLAEATASLDRARAAQHAADLELRRQAELAAVGMATRASLEQAQSAAQQAAAEHARASAAVQRYAGLERNGLPDVQLASRTLETAIATLAQAEQEVAAAKVVSPLDATVIAIHVRAGERPGARGLATLGNTEPMGAELEVYQTDIRKVAHGQVVELVSPSLDAPLRGAVAHIGLEVMRQALLADDPVSNVDARVVKVRVLLDEDSSRRARSLTGLQVTGRFAPSPP